MFQQQVLRSPQGEAGGGTGAPSRPELERKARQILACRLARKSPRDIPIVEDALAVLGLPTTVSSVFFDEAQRSCRRLMQQFHPDTTALPDKRLAHEVTVVLNAAWKIVKDNETRFARVQEGHQPNAEGKSSQPGSGFERDTAWSEPDTLLQINRDRAVRLANDLRRHPAAVLYSLCNYLRRNVLLCPPSLLVQPEEFIGPRGKLNRAESAVAAHKVIDIVGLEAIYNSAAHLISVLEPLLKPTLGMRDIGHRNHQFHHWANLAGVSFEGVNSHLTTLDECIEIAVGEQALFLNSFHKGFRYERMSPLILGAQLQALQALGAYSGVELTALLGTEVPIGVAMKPYVYEAFQQRGFRITSPGMTGPNNFVDNNDGIVLAAGGKVVKLTFDSRRVCTVLVSEKGSSEGVRIVVQERPQSPGTIPTCIEYLLTIPYGNHERATCAPGKIIVSENLDRVHKPLAPLF